MIRIGSRLALAGLVVLSSALASPVSAQGPAAQAGDAGGLEEIVVTARKREESQQDVPISITAFTADTIETRGIESVYDIAKLTPNLSFNQTFGRVFDRPVIRGMSQVLGERTVSFVVDGVYIAGNLTGADLDDLEQVEVLKGPQAVNFGRGSLAGVISYRTRKPTDEWRGRVSASYGDDDYRELAANVSGPIVADKLSFKLGGRYYNYDGQYSGISSDGRRPTFGAEETKRVSGALRFTPTDDLEFLLRAFSARNRDGLYNNIIFTQLNCFTGVGDPMGGSYCGEIPGIPLDGGIGVDLRDIERQGRPGVDQETNLYSLEGNWDLGPVRATALVSWSRQDEDWIVDDYLISRGANATQDPGPTMTNTNPGNITRLITVREYRSQELRFASTGDGPLQWTVGVYHYDSETVGFNGGPRYNVLAMGVPAATNVGAVGVLREISQPTSPFSVDNQAVFGGINWDPTDNWHITLEGRYQKDELTTNNTVQAVVGPNPLGRGTFCAPVLQEEYTSFSPRATVRFDFSPDKNVYFSVSRGNKPGDFNTGVCSANFALTEAQRLAGIAPLAVKEEEADNYELGTKLRFLNGRMSLDAAVFFIDWTNQQVTASEVAFNAVTGMSTNVSLTRNAGETTVKGLEVNWRWRPSDSWDLNAAYGWTDATFDSFCDPTYAQVIGVTVTPPECVGASSVVTASVAGFQTANSPEHTGSLGAEYSLPLLDGRLTTRLDFSYQSERFAEVYNFASTGDTTRLDGRISYQQDDWRIALWGKNLGNDRSPDALTRFFDPDTPPPFRRAYQVHYPNGRSFGLTFNYEFGGR